MSNVKPHVHAESEEQTSLTGNSSVSVAMKAKEEAAASAMNKLIWATGLCFVFMIAEIIGGFMANSLAIMTDAAHLLSDIAGFLISIVAIWLSTRPQTSRLTYGWHRAEILGAMISVFLIWALTGVLVYEAVLRTIDQFSPNPHIHTDGKIMTIVATLGLCVNLALMKVLGHAHSHGPGGGHGHSHGGHGHSHGGDDHGHAHGGDEEEGHGHSHDAVPDTHSHNDSAALRQRNTKSDSDLKSSNYESYQTSSNEVEDDEDDDIQTAEELENINIRAAYIHAMGDLIQSIGVIIAGSCIMYNPKWQLADPIATFVFSLMVLATTVGIMRDSLHVLMEGTPEGIHPKKIQAKLQAIDQVTSVHDLHIWSLTVGSMAASVHIESAAADAEKTLHAAEKVLRSYGIDHTTVQVEHHDGEMKDMLDCAPCDH